MENKPDSVFRAAPEAELSQRSSEPLWGTGQMPRNLRGIHSRKCTPNPTSSGWHKPDQAFAEALINNPVAASRFIRLQLIPQERQITRLVYLKHIVSYTHKLG